MAAHLADGTLFWSRVRRYAVPPLMITSATARRDVGDWAGACAAARVEVDLDLGAAKQAYGAGLVSRLRVDLRHLAPDLLRWHMPRVMPDGLLRPALTVPLVRYDTDARPLWLVVRTPPAWADAGQRMSLALWDGGLAEDAGARRHPHPHPSRRFRLDLHRHLWDARRAGELAGRAAADDQHATRRWPVEAALLLAAERLPPGPVEVRTGAGGRVVLDTRESAAEGAVRSPASSGSPFGDEPSPYEPSPYEPALYEPALLEPALREPASYGPAFGFVQVPVPSVGLASSPRAVPLPLLPDASTWALPDLVLLREGAVEAGELHPLVAEALVPGYSRAVEPAADRAHRFVDCRGERHRIALVDGVLSPLDHAPEQLRREELLAALTGTPLPCLRVIDEAHRRPDCLTGVRERLEHGDVAGALAVVEELLGSEAVLRDGPLKDALAEAAERKVAYGVYRAGLSEGAPERTGERWTGRRTRARRYSRRPVPKR
ncbi:hypothetical protein ABZX85_19045 [Streptomyces sp. NPDC004539]|uniref:hypothetical protein n=1 Tax=Streptomyces sp. NPDC004539 TaxID=3154280 RepID=UPI0033A86D8F